MPVPSQQPDADRQGIASGHQPITVMLDFMHPVRPSWRLFTRRWQARLDEIGLAGARSRSDPNHRKRRLANRWQRLHRQGSLPHVPQSVSRHLDRDIRATAQAKQGLHGKCVRSLVEQAASGGFIVGLRIGRQRFPTHASITKTAALPLLPVASRSVNQLGGHLYGLGFALVTAATSCPNPLLPPAAQQAPAGS